MIPESYIQRAYLHRRPLPARRTSWSSAAACASVARHAPPRVPPPDARALDGAALVRTHREGRGVGQEDKEKDVQIVCDVVPGASSTTDH